MKRPLQFLIDAARPAEFARGRLALKLAPQQEALLNGNTHRVILNCSRQWGKSMAAAAMVVLRMIVEPGCLILILGPALRQPADLLARIEDHLRDLGLEWSRVPKQTLSLRLHNGSRIIGLPGKASTSRGFRKAAMLVIDEAAFVPNALYNAVKPSISVSDGDLWMLSTPDGRKGIFYDSWVDTETRWTKLCVPATECPWISPEVLAEDRRIMGESVFAREYLCQFSDPEWAFFSGHAVEKAVNPELKGFQLALPGPYRVPKKDVPLGRGQGIPCILALDPGMSVTPSGIVAIEQYEKVLYFDKAKWADVKQTVLRVRLLERIQLETPYQDVLRRLKEIATSPALEGRCDVVVDGTGVGAPVLQELRNMKLGCRVVNMKITGGDKSRGGGTEYWVPRLDLLHGLQGALGRGELEIAGDLKETGTLVSELTGMRVGGKKGKSDDLAMALAMGAWWAREGLGWK